MPNPADAISEVSFELKSDVKRGDIAHFLEVLRFINQQRKHWGKITLVKTTGQYTVDIFKSAGYGETLYTEIPAIQIDPQDKFALGNRVQCFLIDGFAYIIGLNIPRGTGRFNVLMLIDDEDPGSMAFDRPRFI